MNKKYYNHRMTIGFFTDISVNGIPVCIVERDDDYSTPRKIVNAEFVKAYLDNPTDVGRDLMAVLADSYNKTEFVSDKSKKRYQKKLNFVSMFLFDEILKKIQDGDIKVEQCEYIFDLFNLVEEFGLSDLSVFANATNNIYMLFDLCRRYTESINREKSLHNLDIAFYTISSGAVRSQEDIKKEIESFCRHRSRYKELGYFLDKHGVLDETRESCLHDNAINVLKDIFYTQVVQY